MTWSLLFWKMFLRLIMESSEKSPGREKLKQELILYGLGYTGAELIEFRNGKINAALRINT